jgi:hypothetical protein
MPPREPDVADDVILLRVVGMVCDGLSANDIRDIIGSSPKRQRAEVNAVIAADLAESGEDQRTIRRAYGLPA